jgi:hypothetical protein
MRKKIAIAWWVVLAAAFSGFAAQEPGGAKADAEAPPGKRLRVEVRETRQRGDETTGTRSSVLTLHADAGTAWVFVGPQVALTATERGAVEFFQFKNAGVKARVSARTRPDGRYDLDVQFEDSSPLAAASPAGPATSGKNPVLKVVRGESRLTAREGETVPFASAVDPVTGEVVRVDVILKAAAEVPPSTGAAQGGGEGRVRADLLLVRRKGETVTARRPYAVVVEPGSDEPANVFGGSMLPVQVQVQGQSTVMLKDVGAGLRLKARQVPDGRYSLDVSFSDGALSPGEGAPRLQVFESESQLFLREGETVTVASGVDPVTGETVEARLSLEGVR